MKLSFFIPWLIWSGCIGATACGGAVDVPASFAAAPEAVDAPEFAGFSSTLQQIDYCARNPQSLACGTSSGEIGQHREAWVWSWYYGVEEGVPGQSRPCGDNSVNCWFPRYKQIRWNRTTGSSKPAWMSQSENGAIWTGCLEGVANLGTQLASAGVTVVNASYDTSDLLLTEGVFSDAILAQTVEWQPLHHQINELPGYPHAADISDGATTTVDTGRIYNDVLYCVGGALPSAWQLRAYARRVCAHEALHRDGIGHFTTGLMGPRSCAEVPSPTNPGFPAYATISPAIVAAIGNYNGNPNGLTTYDDNLGALGPTP